jgi:hypothetical protein
MNPGCNEGFGVHTAVVMKSSVFQDITLEIAESQPTFERSMFLHLQDGKRRIQLATCFKQVSCLA